MTNGRSDQNHDDWTQIRERLKRLADNTEIKSLTEEISKMLNTPEPLTIEQEVAEVIRCCKTDLAFYKKLKAQLREMRGLPR